MLTYGGANNPYQHLVLFLCIILITILITTEDIYNNKEKHNFNQEPAKLIHKHIYRNYSRYDQRYDPSDIFLRKFGDEQIRAPKTGHFSFRSQFVNHTQLRRKFKLNWTGDQERRWSRRESGLLINSETNQKITINFYKNWSFYRNHGGINVGAMFKFWLLVLPS